MSKIKLYTFYKSDGTKQLLYGTSSENALDNAEYSVSTIAETIRGFKEGFDDSLEFIKDRWVEKSNKNKIKIEENEYNKN